MQIDWPATAQMLTAIAAIGALIASPIVAMRIARGQSQDSNKNFLLQVRSEVISKNRQDWINSVRNEVSKFIGELQVLGSAITSSIPGDTPHSLELVIGVHSRLNRIKLLINPNETDHVALVDLLYDLFVNRKDKEKFNAGQSAVISLTQKILKLEWERVKAFT